MPSSRAYCSPAMTFAYFWRIPMVTYNVHDSESRVFYQFTQYNIVFLIKYKIQIDTTYSRVQRRYSTRCTNAETVATVNW